MILKITNTEISISTANTVYNSKLVRLVNPTNANVIVTIVTNATANLGSFTIRGNSEIWLEKANTSQLVGTGILAVPVVYKN